MKRVFTVTFFVLLLLQVNIASGQQNSNTEAKTGLDGGSLESQLNYVISKSEKYEAYQVVKRTWLYKIKSNVLDSLKSLKENIITLESNGQEQQKEFNMLKSNLKETNEKLERAIEERDSFSFLGILLTKNVYSTMLWLVILGLIAALLIIIFLFKRSNAITIKTKEALNDKQEEFDAHRKWALEREQSLARELNKLKQKYKGLD